MKGILFAGLIAVFPLAAQDNSQTSNVVVLRSDVDALKAFEGVRLSDGVVKGAPFSAEATTTTTQSLADGNRIEQSTSQKLYRDNAGRGRREESMLAIGALAQPEAPRTISISDPVANVSYTLDPHAHTARRMPGARVAYTTLTAGNTTVTLNLGLLSPSLAARNSEDTSRTKEDLGLKTIEGVTAQGTRTTETIPAGKIGNVLPINVVDEVWYSPELKMNVMTTHTDPRTGEVVYKLTNINRGEQPQSLFEPPADYTITGPAPGGRGRGPAPAPTNWSTPK